MFETGATQGTAPFPPVRSFHPKAYIFRRGDTGSAFVGSSNLSASALTTAVEWNYRVVSSADGSGFQETITAFEELFAHPNARPLDAPWIERYRQPRTIQRPIVEAADVEWEAPQAPVECWPHWTRAAMVRSSSFRVAEPEPHGPGAAPFVYCGDVQFVEWRGEKPITVQWKLPEAVPARLRGDLRVPETPPGR